MQPTICRRHRSYGWQQDLTNRLVDRAMALGTEVGTGKIITNSTSNISADTSTSSQKLQEVTNFKYLEANLCKDGTWLAEVRIRIALAMATMAILSRI